MAFIISRIIHARGAGRAVVKPGRFSRVLDFGEFRIHA
jgi:hypothetical protein